ncbi:MAG: hypothetical protein JJU10_00250 [Idiomarina sp.]|nr:hypothetical protein [Idiomarina sp.]MCH8479185.1 hypothetical protein [Wenzhouxiangella sp.]
MEIIAWHGGWGKFSAVDEKYHGSGEGDSQGWGFYAAENRVGGEYFARYMHCRNDKVYLHKIRFEIQEHEFWKNADKTGKKLSTGEIFSYSKYFDLRQKIGDEMAAKYLRSNGVKAFMLWETDKPPHGYTYVILQPEIVQVVESYEYIFDVKQSYWKKIA